MMDETNNVGRQPVPPTVRSHRSASTSLSFEPSQREPQDLMTKFTNDVRRANNHNNSNNNNNNNNINHNNNNNNSHVNQRRSRGRFGRGLAKKNGAGGHFTWGAAGSEFSGDQLEKGSGRVVGTSDPHDPNYDSDSEANCKFEAITPPLDDDEVERFLKPVLLDYFEHGDTGEVLSTLAEVNLSGNYHRVPVVVVSLALDRKSSHRELASVLISDLLGKALKSEDIQRAFDVLLQQLDDLELDTPDASTVLGNFVARAIADDCIPPKYVTTAKDYLESKRDSPASDHQLTAAEARALASLTYANSLINAKRGLIRLDTVWGLTGGARPVKYLIKKMRLLLKEYLSSRDAIEAERCLRELEVPHFLHEFVYEAILMGIEDTKTPDELTAIAKLLKALSDINLVSVDQMKKGFLRLFNEIPEIHIDVPYAYSTLERFMQSCFEIKLFLPRDVIVSVPTRGRKRFISEGDGGRVKE